MPAAASVALTPPALPGEVPFDTIIDAAAGLVYPAPLSPYAMYSTPAPAYLPPRINIAACANLGGGAPWPFASSAVPRNGQVCVPQGRGPFPLGVFAHGNHQPVENSSPGYLYLCRLLASHGIIAATIDVNFLNGGNFGENDGRASVHLDPLKQFRTWNHTAGHHHQEGAAPPVVSLPAQGTVLADRVTATRALSALVPGVTTTLTLRLAWRASGGRLLVRVAPATVPAERYKVLSLRVGQSVEAAKPAHRDQDCTLEVASGARTLALAARALHRRLSPAAPIGGQKIMRQPLRLPVQRRREAGVDPTDLRAISCVCARRLAGGVGVGDLQCST